MVPGIGEEALAILERGQYFGEMSLIEEGPRSADAIAHTSCLLYELSREKLDEVMFTDKELASTLLWTFVRTLSSRLRETNDKIRAFFALSSIGLNVRAAVAAAGLTGAAVALRHAGGAHVVRLALAERGEPVDEVVALGVVDGLEADVEVLPVDAAVAAIGRPEVLKVGALGRHALGEGRVRLARAHVAAAVLEAAVVVGAVFPGVGDRDAACEDQHGGREGEGSKHAGGPYHR
jgi:hypothetical protein